MSLSELAVSPTASLLKSCVICQQKISGYAFTIGKNKFLQCGHCRTIASENKDANSAADFSALQSANRDADALGKLVLDTLKYRSAEAPYLVVSTPNEHSLMANLKQNLASSTVYKNAADIAIDNPIKLGTVLVLTPLSKIIELDNFLEKLRAALKENGVLIFLQPMLDSSQAKLMKKNWLEWNQPHAFYPTRDALHIKMLDQGFDKVWFHKARYPYTLEYIYQRLQNSRSGIIYHLMAKLSLLLPFFFHKIKFRLPSSHVITSCQLATPKREPTLSVVLPVFNEKNTFEDLIQALLAKTVEGLHKQIIIVESNSTDGTRDLVKKYADHPDVQVIWQTEAKGKGFAVREGLAAATGDYVLIQDADLEYDINDYESLLAPLRTNQNMFVLGSRHSGNWRIREFNDAVTTATIFNLGHIFFTWYINLLTGQKMADPFTMFKVFRRDALFGLNFICKRFDFDHEMVIKLCRKGYQPIELPVNYQARSFAEGKKVSFVKDGLTWVTTNLKLRFGKLGKWPS